MLEAPHNFERYKRDGELYRFIFNNDEKYSLHWANNGNKSFRDQLDEEIPTKSYQTFMLIDTPFELSDEGKIAISVDYITKKWNYYYPEKWRKSRKINNIEYYKEFLISELQFQD